MKYLLILSLFICFSCSKPKDTIPQNHLSPEKIEDFKYKISRYIEKLPRLATEKNKFDKQFDTTYKLSAKNSELMHYYIDEDNYIYFAISKIAPSIKLKKTTTVGKLKFDKNDSIVFYQEAFRTWKMEPKELEEKTKLLFDKYLNNEDLSDYYTVNSNPEFFIEFPDEITQFDTISRTWKIKTK